MNPQIAGEFIAGRRVQVYFNLHRKTFSIRDARTKRVVGYAQHKIRATCHSCRDSVPESTRTIPQSRGHQPAI